MSIDDLTAVTLWTGCVLATLAVTVVLTARPWEMRGLSLIDQLRIAEVVSRYDFWLGWRGAGVRERRDLRTELRANLFASSAVSGAREAVRAVGSTRALASATTGGVRVRWGLGLLVGTIALELVVGAQLALAATVLDAADAARVTTLDVAVTVVPGMHVHVDPVTGGGARMTADLGPAALVVGLLVAVAIARPWLALRRRRTTPAA